MTGLVLIDHCALRARDRPIKGCASPQAASSPLGSLPRSLSARDPPGPANTSIGRGPLSNRSRHRIDTPQPTTRPARQSVELSQPRDPTGPTNLSMHRHTPQLHSDAARHRQLPGGVPVARISTRLLPQPHAMPRRPISPRWRMGNRDEKIPTVQRRNNTGNRHALVARRPVVSWHAHESACRHATRGDLPPLGDQPQRT